ncbi:MAG: four helix bundle protein [Paludibacteraceae bacterium]|jgi:four helix bundle protein|nr:four helix bundle protein [Paludibacteraceae bacterium]
MAKENIVIDKSYAFALRIIKLYKYLADTHKEYVISKQVLRSGTAIGALLSELVYAQSKADFINKAHVALKEANETAYWLSLLKDSEYISIDSYNSIYTDCNELIKLLVSIVKTSKNNQ